MKTLVIAIFIIGALTNPSPAEDKWTKTNTVMELSWISLHLVDWGQTLQIAKNPNRFHERNPILGRHPSIRSVNRFMIIGLVTHVSASFVLPHDIRNFWQVTSIVVAGIIVTNNFKIGLTF